MPLSGVLYDRWGKRKTVLLASLIGVISISMMPFVRSIYPGFLVCRFGFDFFFFSIFNCPIVGDYVNPDSLGKASSVFAIS